MGVDNMAKTSAEVLDNSTQIEAEPPKRKAGRPKKGEPAQIEAAERFFQTLRKIPADAWTDGKALVKVYRREPCIDRLASGKDKHIAEYYQPIESEERIKQDQGSGKYLLFLNYQGPKDGRLREIDKAFIDILDMHFPPKVPAGDWLEEPKNKIWLWAFPDYGKPPAAAAAPSQSSGVQDVLETFKTFDQIQTTLAAKAQAQQPVSSALATPATPTADPFASGMSFAKEILQMKSDNPMVDMMRDELKDMRAEMRAERERSERLQNELRSKENQPPAKTGLGTLKEIIADAQSIGILPADIKSLWGKAEGALQAVTRSRMSGSEEFWQPIIIGIADAIKPALPMVVARLVAPKPPQPGQQAPQQTAALPSPAPPQPGAPPAPGSPQPGTNGAASAAAAADAPPIDQQQALAFFGAFAPPMLKFFKEGGKGEDFADWIYEGHGADWNGVKWLHLKQAVGTERTLEGFKVSPFWPEIATVEEKFTEFVKAFVDWQPAASEAVVDLDNQDEMEEN
jgi:hypothetical protein